MLSLQTTKWRRDVTNACPCEPVRAWQSSLLTFLSLRGRSRRELTWQSSLKRHVGCRGDAVGCPMVPLDCRVAALLAMTTVGSGGRGGFVSGLGTYPLCCHCEPGRAWQSGLLTFLSLRGRSRRELTWQSSLKCHVGCRGDAVGCPMVPPDCRVGTFSFLD
jgi:hypothetical protein